MQSKIKIRESFRQKRQELPQNVVETASAQFCVQLDRVLESLSFNNIATYSPIQNEVSPISLISTLIATKTVAIPRYNPTHDTYQLAIVNDLETDLVPSRYGILEPKPSCPILQTQDCGLWLVPGLAFDSNGYRLGFGAGIYDTLLAETTGLKVGCGYDWQYIPELPHEGHDIPMDFLVTETNSEQFH